MCVCDVVRRAGALVSSAGVLREAEKVGAGPRAGRITGFLT